MFDDDADIQANQRANVACPGTVAGGHQHGIVHTTQAHADLGNTRIQAARVSVQALQKGHLVRLGHDIQRVICFIQWLVAAAFPGLHTTSLTGAGNRPRSANRLAQGRHADIVAVGEAGLLTGLGTHANALIDIEAAILDDAVLQHPGLTDLMLKIQVGSVDAWRGDDLTEHLGNGIWREFRWHQQTMFNLGEQVTHGVQTPWQPGRACPQRQNDGAAQPAYARAQT